MVVHVVLIITTISVEWFYGSKCVVMEIHAIQRPELRTRGTRLVTLTVSEEKSNQHHVTTKTINGTQVEDTPSGNQKKTLQGYMKLLTKKDVEHPITESQNGIGWRWRAAQKRLFFFFKLCPTREHNRNHDTEYS